MTNGTDPQSPAPEDPASGQRKGRARVSRKDSTSSTEAIADVIRERIARGAPVRRTLPGRGRLHVDRPLPFITVHVEPDDRPDAGTNQLVTTEASYLYSIAERGGRKQAAELVRVLSETVRPSFGKQFLIVAVCSRPPEHAPVVESSKDTPHPSFRLFTTAPGQNCRSIGVGPMK